jgi:RES domain-containing protein
VSRLPDAGDRLEQLPVWSVPAGSRWLRIAAHRFPTPLFFNRAPGGRFNPRSRRFGTLYLAQTLVGAIAESICRGAAQRPVDGRTVSEIYLRSRSLYRIEIGAALRLADFTVSRLARYRLDARIYAEYDAEGPNEYRHGPEWADHLQTLGLDGILYPSRHHTASQCLAVFQRESLPLDHRSLGTLWEQDEVLEVLETEFDWSID